MKRKTIRFIALAGIVAIAAAIYLFIYSTPRPVVRDPAKANVQSIQLYSTQQYLTLDATQENAVLTLLSRYQCRRTMRTYAPFYRENADYELTLHTETEIPWHILIGKVNICYVSSDQGYFEIMDAKNLSAELKGIVG